MSDLVSELTDRDRRYLQRMVSAPGYKVLEKLILGFVQTAEDHAIAISKVDPLVNAKTIAQAWAYYSIAERFRANLAGAVQFELRILNKEVTAPLTTEQLAERRRMTVLGELDVMHEENDEDRMAE